jgi:hypothetical protein
MSYFIILIIILLLFHYVYVIIFFFLAFYFSPQLSEAVQILKPHFQKIVVPVAENAKRIDDAFHKKKSADHASESQSASTILHNIDRDYFLFRKRHIENKTLADLHPAIRQLTTFLYQTFPISLLLTSSHHSLEDSRFQL